MGNTARRLLLDAQPATSRTPETQGEVIYAVAVPIHQKLSLKTYEKSTAVTPSRFTPPRGYRKWEGEGV